MSGADASSAATGLDRRLLLDAGRDAICATIGAALATRCAIGADDVLAVAASGGPDSGALLLFAGALAERGALRRVVAIHVDHGLRPESCAEGDLVEALAERVGASCERRSIALDADAPNLAARARAARLRALADAARAHGADAIALGHHADDRAETMLHALLRGSGPTGLASLRWRRPFPVDAGVTGTGRSDASSAPAAPDLVRPCLQLTRDALVDACARHRVPVAFDPTNHDPATLRGWMRARLAPLLEARFPGAIERVAASAERLAIAPEAIEESLDRRFGPDARGPWSRSRLAAESVPWRTALLRRALLHLRSDAADATRAVELERVALAIGDGEQRPREWAIMPGTTIEIDAHAVRLVEHGSIAPTNRGPEQR